jgi:XTP/dITP diphosphohydrolase
MQDIVIATQNLDKFKEIRALLSDLRVNFLNLKGFDLPEEKGNSLEENAIAKAENGVRLTNKISIADDTGLEVEALNGLPGVYSARFAGKNASYEDNRKKLLKMLLPFSNEERKAKFRCVIAIAGIKGEPTQIFKGEIEGYITYKEKGEFGFGYDSIFLVPQFNKTLAELLPSIKNSISHRAKAISKLKNYLERKLKYSAGA